MQRTSVLLALFIAPDLTRAEEKKRPVTGEARPTLAGIDRLLEQFMADHAVPGAAVAVAKDGRLVYARGFGFADVDKKTPVQPDALFRLASVSKPFTLAAICLLVERKKLKFDDAILDVLKLKLPDSLDPKWRRITVGHLVEHRGGFDHGEETDPMFNAVAIAREFKAPPPAKPDHIIRHMLAKPLVFEPGSKQAYSNFGYCLLGRVIEKASGQPYEKFVADELLKPIGITSMRLGRTMSTAKGEVRYYEQQPAKAPSVFANYLGQRVPSPYGAWCLESMDSDGGWIGSAIDVARFGSAIDFPARFLVVKGASFDQKFNPDYFHYGAFSGSSTLFHRTSAGLTYAVLFNARLTTDGKELGSAIHDPLKEVLAAVKEWPTGDLFR